MKRISFLVVLIAGFFSFNAAKAQVGVHIGVNLGAPAYYAPAPPPPPVCYEPDRVVVVHRRPVYYRPYGYYNRPVIVERGYYGPRRVMVVPPGHYRRHGMYRRW